MTSWIVAILACAASQRSPRASGPGANENRQDSEPQADTTRIESLFDQMDSHDRRLSATERAAKQLGRQWQSVAAGYKAAKRKYVQAERRLARARRTADDNASAFRRASDDFDVSARRWRVYQKLVQIAAYIDMRHLAAQQGSAESIGLSCERTTTASYRRMLNATGQNLNDIEIDHIVPKALGGADHVDNYCPIDASLNASLGKTWNLRKCLICGVEKCATAVAVSMKCGSLDDPGF